MKKVLLVLLLALICLTSVFARPTVALVLAGGSSKGLMHIPVIQELERRGIYPDLVVGTSMGALIGGLYASGYSGDDLYEFVMSLDFEAAIMNFAGFAPDGQIDYFDYNVATIPFSSDGLGNSNSILDDSGINNMLRKALARVADIDDFDDLSIPFRTLATDFKKGTGRIFDSGSMFDALRSSMSMPVFFPPYILEDGTYMVDGGMVENLPVSIAKDAGADIVIGVDVSDSLREQGAEGDSLDTLSGVFNQYLLLTTQIGSIKEYDEIDYLLIPDTTGIGMVDFSDIESILQRGQQFVDENQELFDQIEEALAPYGPFEKPSPSYSERGYITIERIEYPGSLSKYGSQLDDFEGRAYDEDFIDEFDDLIEDIIDSQNLKDINYYVSKDGVIKLAPKEYVLLPSSLSLGLTGGFFTAFGSGFSNYGFDMKLSLALQIKGNQDYEFGIVVGRQSYVHLGVDVSLSTTLYWSTFAEAGYGGFSVISSPYLENHISGRDWKAGAATGLLFQPDDYNTLSLYAKFDYYFLGNDSTFSGEIPTWDNQHVLLPYASLSYLYSGGFSRFAHRLDAEARAGWRDGFIWSLDLDYTLVFRISARNALALDVKVFSSRFPYELLSSYHQNRFGLVSRDYLQAGLVFSTVLANYLDGVSLSLGAYFIAHDNNASVPERGNGVLQAPASSLAPFTDLDKFTLGLTAEVDVDTGVGSVGVFVSGLISGRMAIGISVK